MNNIVDAIAPHQRHRRHKFNLGHSTNGPGAASTGRGKRLHAVPGMGAFSRLVAGRRQ